MGNQPRMYAEEKAFMMALASQYVLTFLSIIAPADRSRIW